MPVGHYLLMSGVLGALTVVNETPDAFCPPTESVRSDVASRVGEVMGADYVVSYRVVRDVPTGQNFVHLRLLDSAGEPLLTREIPTKEADCSDVSQAMALILDNYFASASLSKPRHDKSSSEAVDDGEAPNLGSGSGEGEEEGAIERPQLALSKGAADGGAQSAPARTLEAEEPSRSPDDGGRDRAPSPIWLRGGAFLSDRIQFGLGLFVGLKWRSGSIYTGAIFEPGRRSDDTEAYRVNYASHQGVVGAQLEHEFVDRWGVFAGTEVGAELQVAELEGDDFASSGQQPRVIPTWGSLVGLSLALSEYVALGVLGRGTVRIGSRELIVERNDGGRSELDPLPDVKWDGALFTRFTF